MVRHEEHPAPPEVPERSSKPSVFALRRGGPRDFIKVVAVILAIPVALFIARLAADVAARAFSPIIENLLRISMPYPADPGGPSELFFGVSFLVLFVFAIVLCINMFDDWARAIAKRFSPRERPRRMRED